MPLSLTGDTAEVVACAPDDPALKRTIRERLGVDKITFLTTTPADLIRLIENSADLNADFPTSAARTPLAKVRTYFANLRTRYAAQRTQFARSRTGLALTRTGLAGLSIAVGFLRFFGAGDLLIIELPLLALGIAAIADGLYWYFPARRVRRNIKPYAHYCEIPEAFSAIEVADPGGEMHFHRSPVVGSAGALRQEWDTLSPVERRRFLANDRTNMADERTVLAYLRTLMAKARTGLALARTGAAFAGIGVLFLRQFQPGPWSPFDWALIAVGTLMLAEGFYCYLPGRKAANSGLENVNEASAKPGPWELIFPSSCLYKALKQHQAAEASSPQAQPGVWATTGLALERTVLADKRNVMARLRTVMARSRTGMAFIRTGFSIMTVGAALLVYFGAGDALWTGVEILLVAGGLYLVGDGLLWYVPAERMRRHSTFSGMDFEIAHPDYTKPVSSWNKTSFSHDN